MPWLLASHTIAAHRASYYSGTTSTLYHTLSKVAASTHEDFRLPSATHCNTTVASVPEVFRYCAAGISDYSYIQQRTPPESLLLPTTIPVH